MTKQPFKSSIRLYALNRTEIEEFQHEGKTSDGYRCSRYTIPAVWYKKKNGSWFACSGYLVRFMQSGEDFKILTSKSDRWYGFTTEFVARYDGENFWGIPDVSNIKEQEKIIKLLSPMVKKMPSLPKGYEGWYAINELERKSVELSS